jgi:hypothetical protein
VLNPTAVALLTRDPELAALAKACVWEAGVAVAELTDPEQLDALEAAPGLAILGHDIGGGVAGAIRAAWPNCTLVGVAVGEHPGAAPPGDLVLPGAWARLTALVEATYAAPRTARRLALIGAHGGAGTSCLAVATARCLAGEAPVKLAALNPAGAPLGPLLALDVAVTWANAVAAAEGGAPLQPRSALGVELLSSVGPADGLPAWQVRRAIETWEEGSAFTVLDAARSGSCGGWRAGSWADTTVIVARGEAAALAAVRPLLGELRALGVEPVLAVREVPGGIRAAEAAERLGFANVVRVGHERVLPAALVHGLVPGERARGPLASAAGAIARLAAPALGGGAGLRRRWGRQASAPARQPGASGRRGARDHWGPQNSGEHWDVRDLRDSGEHWDVRDIADRRPDRDSRDIPDPRGSGVARDRRSGRAGSRFGLRNRVPRLPAPAFNPAAFAEEW